MVLGHGLSRRCSMFRPVAGAAGFGQNWRIHSFQLRRLIAPLHHAHLPADRGGAEQGAVLGLRHLVVLVDVARDELDLEHIVLPADGGDVGRGDGAAVHTFTNGGAISQSMKLNGNITSKSQPLQLTIQCVVDSWSLQGRYIMTLPYCEHCNVGSTNPRSVVTLAGMSSE